MSKKSFSCRFCAECLGCGCIGELPGMGGAQKNINFRLNCLAWDKYAAGTAAPRIRLAPITGGVENVGYKSERSFYFDIIDAASDAGMALSIGDGVPDCKLLNGIGAVKKAQTQHPEKRAAVFIKPYQNDRIFERILRSIPVAEIIGIDTDSWNIITMRKKAHLEQKSAEQLREIKQFCKVPFAIKGVFTENDIEIVKQVRPDIAVVSNHGGRIETRTGSTADFLAEHGRTLARYCGELWVDGGIRKPRDILAAAKLGAAEILVGRPVVSALCRSGKTGVMEFMNTLCGNAYTRS
ncbi:MAG: alpha-hydroxy-acid oxidizing protein [Bacteroides sp.]|nr:alpha-hydroxy-acid oxidizing protein [Prevotella sp.]MCM1408407.1 alpha-hydroxy-acid oxidizing protein [Treponema brennaborense]MCM1469431.1 alpha-hydroxy-acid oxidizing protein [Bacteroides sp.]